MALTRFVETYQPTVEEYNAVVSSRKFTESDGTALSSNRISESTKKFIENNPVASLVGKTIYRVPVSRYDWTNANGRKYEKRLWQRVIDEQAESYRGGLGLADHPEGDNDGSFKDASVVWLNMGIDESTKTVWSECVFVGPWGKLAEEIMDAGGRVGFSSSGFGELDENDKSTVRWDSYLLERVSDIVLNPSQNVFGKKENKVSTQNPTRESSTNQGAQEPTRMTEKIVETGKVSKLEEKKMMRDAEGFLQEAIQVSDPSLRIDELSMIVESLTGKSDSFKPIIERASLEITKAHEQIKTAIQEQIKLKETFDVNTTEEIKEGVKKLSKDNEFYEKDASQWRTLAESLRDKVQTYQAIIESLPSAEAYSKAVNFSTALKDAFIQKEKEWKFQEASIRKAYAAKVEEIKTLNSNLSAYKEALIQEKKNTVLVQKSLEKATRLLTEHKKQKAQIAEAAHLKAQKANEINFRPKAKGGNPMFNGFNEAEDVAEYYADLQERWGEQIEPYKDSILNCKTLKEAMFLSTKAIASFDSAKTSKLTEALDPSERRRFIEETTGYKVASTTKKSGNLNLPGTWE